MSYYELDAGHKLLLLQGISLIEDGLEFLEWMSDTPNENAFDMLAILRDRFEVFRDFALADGECDSFLIGKIKKSVGNVQYGLDSKERVKKELDNLWVLANKEYRDSKQTEK